MIPWDAGNYANHIPRSTPVCWRNDSGISQPTSTVERNERGESRQILPDSCRKAFQRRLSLIYRPLINRIAANRSDIPVLNAPRVIDSGFYRPLTDAEWNELSRKVRGTLLDQPITFRQGSTEIPEGFREELQDAVPKLRHYPTYRIVVEAHVTSSGEPQADQTLSEERALAVKRFLMWECGVSDERVRSIGKGASEPVARLAAESDTSLERRSRRARVILVGE